MSRAVEDFQITPEQAQFYEDSFVPGIVAEWAPRLVGFAGVAPGDAVLDVACGTGIVARTAADAVGPSGSVTGIDLNPAMLDVARKMRAELSWQQGDAATLPFPDNDFDVVLSQMALMFMPDRGRVLAEMARVARRRVGVLVPASLGDQPAYAALTRVVAQHAGEDGASLMATYWSCGDLAWLTALVHECGAVNVHSRTVSGTAAFPTLEAMIATEVEGSPLIDRINEATYARIREDGVAALSAYRTVQGGVKAPLVCHMVIGDVTRG